MIGPSDLANPYVNPSTNWTLTTRTDKTLNSYEYSELQSGGDEAWSKDNSQLNRKFRIRWDQRDLFVADLLGQNLLNGSNDINRRTPDQHPTYGNFFAVDARVRPEGTGVSAPSTNGTAADIEVKHNFGIVEAVYRQLPYVLKVDTEVLEDGVYREYNRYTSFNYSFESQYVQLTCTPEVGAEGAKTIFRKKITKLVSAMEIKATWHRVPGANSNTLRCPVEDRVAVLQGKINEVEFLGFPRGSVLFLGMEPKMGFATVDTNPTYEGTPMTEWDITYTFKVRRGCNSAPSYCTDCLDTTVTPNEAYGWNYTLTCNGWQRVSFVNSTLTNYEYGDLRELFLIDDC